MTAYKWREGMPSPKVSADVFGSVKDRIEGERGAVLPEDIVNAARNPRSPIHGALEWEDAVAAEHHRLQQARTLLNGLQVVRVSIERSPEVTTKAMFRVRPDNGKAGYVSSDRIIADRELRKQVVASARRELESYVRKYSGVIALGPFVPQLQEIIDEMLDAIEQLQVDANARRQRPAAKSEYAPQPAAAA